MVISKCYNIVLLINFDLKAREKRSLYFKDRQRLRPINNNKRTRNHSKSIFSCFCNYITFSCKINDEVLFVVGLRFLGVEKAELVGKDRQLRLHTYRKGVKMIKNFIKFTSVIISQFFSKSMARL